MASGLLKPGFGLRVTALNGDLAAESKRGLAHVRAQKRNKASDTQKGEDKAHVYDNA